MGGGFRQLQVWQRGKALAVASYRISASGPLSVDFGLRDQLRRAALSVCSDIAEGDAPQPDKESVPLFYIAKGSLAERSAQLDIALEVHSLLYAAVALLIGECEAVGAMLQAIIIHRRQ